MSEWTKERIEDLSDQLAEFAEIPFSDQVDAIVEIERLQAENETLRAEKRWIPVEERLPEIGKEVLVYFASSDRVEVASRRGSDGEFYSPSQQGYSWSNITHWQHLPSVEVLK